MANAIAIVLLVMGTMYIVVLGKDIHKNRNNLGNEKISVAGIISVITSFFDVLGIGAFATTTAVFKLTKFLKSDKYLPGTLNVGFTIPMILEALFFTRFVQVEALTLITMVVSSVLGSYLGAKIVTKLSEKKIQIFMGAAMLVTAAVMFLKQFNIIESLGVGNEAMGLNGTALVIAVVFSFLIGSLVNFGIGNFAPTMALVYMLGLNPLAAFPIMMTSAAAFLPVTSIQFIKRERYAKKGVIGLAIGGLVGVFIAAVFVRSLDLTVLTWIIIFVVAITGVMLLYSAFNKKRNV